LAIRRRKTDADADALEVEVIGQRFYQHSTTFDDWVPHLSKPMVVICRAH